MKLLKYIKQQFGKYCSSCNKSYSLGSGHNFDCCK